MCPTLSVTASWVGLNAERWHGFWVGAGGFYAVDPKPPGASWAGPIPPLPVGWTFPLFRPFCDQFKSAVLHVFCVLFFLKPIQK